MIPSLVRRLPYIQSRAALSASTSLLDSSSSSSRSPSFSSSPKLKRKNANETTTTMMTAYSTGHGAHRKFFTCQVTIKPRLCRINNYNTNNNNFTTIMKCNNMSICTPSVSSSVSEAAAVIVKPTVFNPTFITSDTHESDDTENENKPAELMFYEAFEIDDESDVDWQLLCEAHRKHGVWLTVPPQTPPKLPHVGPPVIPETIFSKRQSKRLRKMKLAYNPTHNPPPLHTTGTRTLNVNDLYESTGQSNSRKNKTNKLNNIENGSSRNINTINGKNDSGMNTTRRKNNSKAKMKTYTTVVNSYEDIYNFNYDDDDEDDDNEEVDFDKQYKKNEEKEGKESNEETGSKLESNNIVTEEKTNSSLSNETHENEKSNTELDNNCSTNKSSKNKEKNKDDEEKEKKRKERARLLKSKMYENAPLELPNEENIEELLFAIWDGVALKRSDIVKPTGLPEEVYSLNASFASNESDLLLNTDNIDENNDNMEREGEGEESVDIERVIEAKHKKHRIEAERIRQTKFGHLHLDSKNGEFFIPALMIVEGKADRRDEELQKKLNGSAGNSESSKESSRATPLGAAPGVKRTSTLSYLQYAGMKTQRDNINVNNDIEEDYDGQSSLQLLLSLIGSPTRVSQPSQQYKETLNNENSSSQTAASAAAVVENNKVKSSKVPHHANSFSTYFIFSTIREASKRFANPFGDSPNAIILEEKKEPINPFINLESKAEQYMTLLENKTKGIESMNTNNENECVESLQNNYNGSEENANENEEDGEDNEIMYNMLRKEWLSRPFVCPFCKQFSLNALQSQQDKTGNNTKAEEEHEKRDDEDDVSESNAIERKLNTTLTHSLILEHVKRFRLLDGLLDHFDDAHYDAWNHGSRELNESIMQSLYEVERHKLKAVEAQVAEYKIAKREERNEKKKANQIKAQNNNYNKCTNCKDEAANNENNNEELENHSGLEEQDEAEQLESKDNNNNNNNIDIITSNNNQFTNIINKEKEKEKQMQNDVQNNLLHEEEQVKINSQDTLMNKTGKADKVLTNNTVNNFTNQKVNVNNTSTNTFTSKASNHSINNNNKNENNGVKVLTKDEIDVHARVGVNTTLIGIVKDIQCGFIDNERVLQYVIAVATPSPNSEMVKTKQKTNMTKESKKSNKQDSQLSQENEEEEDENDEENEQDLDEEELIIVRCVGSRLPVALLMANIHLNSWVYVSGLLKCNRHLDNKSRRIHAYPYVQVNPPLGTIRALYERY